MTDLEAIPQTQEKHGWPPKTEAWIWIPKEELNRIYERVDLAESKNIRAFLWPHNDQVADLELIKFIPAESRAVPLQEEWKHCLERLAKELGREKEFGERLLNAYNETVEEHNRLKELIEEDRTLNYRFGMALGALQGVEAQLEDCGLKARIQEIIKQLKEGDALELHPERKET